MALIKKSLPYFSLTISPLSPHFPKLAFSAKGLKSPEKENTPFD